MPEQWVEQNQKRRFVSIPEAIIGAKELTLSERLILARITGFETYFESVENCALFLGISEDAVFKARRKLEKMGLIICLKNTGRGKVYTTNLDDISKKLRKYQPDYENLPDRLVKFTNQTSKIYQSDYENLPTYNKVKNKVKNKDICISDVKTSDARSSKELPEEAYNLAEHLKKKILDYQPTAHISPTYRKNWAKDFEKAHRLDGRRWKAMEEMINYCFDKSDFWGMNIRSGAKLRKHYDRIESEIGRDFLKHGTMIVGEQDNSSNIYDIPF